MPMYQGLMEIPGFSQNFQQISRYFFSKIYNIIGFSRLSGDPECTNSTDTVYFTFNTAPRFTLASYTLMKSTRQ